METALLQKDKAIRLFSYLKELSLLKTPLIRDIRQYESFIFLNGVPNEPECLSPLFTESKDTWIEIQKPAKPVFPNIPEKIVTWINPTFQPGAIDGDPILLDKIPNPHFEEKELDEEAKNDDSTPYFFIEDFPDIQAEFESYVTNRWIPWKNEAIRYEAVQEIYTKLFSLYQKQKKLGEQYELLVGVGLLNWQTPEKQIVHRHILMVPCQFQFDASKGMIRVIPSAEGGKAEIEQDMLELDSRLDHKTLAPLKEILEELQVDFWKKSLLDTLFRSFVFSLSANGSYQNEEYNHIKLAGKEPNITYSPALILRKRTEKGFQQACSSIIERTDEGAGIPQGILRIFEEMDDYTDSEKTFSAAPSMELNEDATVFFPLNSNEEQRKIISNLETRNGVLVQGPPGTGKSHTIANLTSHLLATGKKVLITSETPRALRVLKDKLPIELQALCVSLLGGDSKSFKDLESVVQAISNKRDTWDKDYTSTLITQLTTKLRKDKEKQAQIQHQLRSLREKETFEHHLLNGLYSGTAQKIAAKLSKERQDYQWLTDSIDMENDLPLENSEAAELLGLLKELNELNQNELELSVPSLDLLISVTEFQNKIARADELIEKKANFPSIQEEETNQLLTINKERRIQLLQLLSELLQAYRNACSKNEEWLVSGLEALIQGKFTPWEEFYHQISEHMDEIDVLVNKHNLSEITGASEININQLYSDAKLLKAHFESGKGLGMPLLRPKVVKDAWYIVKDVRIDGRKCNTLESLISLEEAVFTELAFKKIDQMMLDHLKVKNDSPSSRVLKLAAIKDTLKPFSLLFAAKQAISKIKQDYQDISMIVQNSLDETRINKLTLHLEFVSLKEELDQINDHFSQLIKNINNSILSKETHPIVNLLVKSIENHNVEGYREAFDKIYELDAYSKKSRRCEELLQKLKEVLPKLYNSLIVNFEYGSWVKRFETFDKAFNWAKVNSWFQHFSLTSMESLKNNLKDLEASIKLTITKLAVEKAWYSTLTTMTEGQRQHLLAWTTSMRKVGKGTGKNANIHLRDAQKHMSECRDAIPAWIMPLYRVFETFEVKPNLFDVVIIDEASQSGPDAVILQYIAKKLIVVGDDKQISPEYVGIKREDIQYLRNQYLFDFKLADLLDIENSFFDLANVLFGGRITLREHFRCMPEIIQFSNKISYTNTPLIPLRQYPPNRLEPVVTRHVLSGYREGAGSKVFNRPEAEAVAIEIQKCISNPLYEGKTIGVISLQNEGQAQLIEKLLIEQIGPEEMEKRNIICGDAYAFQGDERDIMFLSMVAAPGETAMRALTTEKDKRRFNVAVSRAKDQLWLFHSPTINDIRNKECLRYQLISYCENPAREILESNRALCESNFEKAVFDQITNRGYRVIPQLKVAGYRIDLVVEGAKGRIAVECDGDQWHGPDRFDYDMNRQRILERSGWRFWRVRGSEFYYDSEKAMASLWETLDYYDIKPENTNTQNDNHVFGDHLNNHLNQNNIYQALHEAAAGSEEIDRQNDNLNEMQDLEPLTPIQQNDSKNGTSPTLNLGQYLIENGFEVVDKRSNGGALWLIGGKEITPFISELKKHNINFTYAYNGSKSSSKRPAWFTTYQN